MLREYFIGAVYLAVFVALLLGISHPSLKSIAALGAGVLIICAILLPLVDIFATFNADDVLDGMLNDMNYDATDSAIELAFESGISEYLMDLYELDDGCVSVRVDGFDISSLKAERIYVTLRGRGSLVDPKRVSEEVEKRFTNGGECEVTIRLG